MFGFAVQGNVLNACVSLNNSNQVGEVSCAQMLWITMWKGHV